MEGTAGGISEGGGGSVDSGGTGSVAGNGSGDSGRQAAPPSQAGEQKESKQNGNGAQKQSESAAAKLKAKWRGADHEAEPAELRKMLSDDYEHEFPGPAGKSVKLRWNDIQRAVQQSHGWENKMREANSLRQKHEEELKAARGDIPGYIEARLIDREAKDGPKSFDDIATQHVARMYKESEELRELSEPYVTGRDGKLYQNPKYNPIEAQNRMQAKAKAALERQQSLDNKMREQQERQRQDSEQGEKNRKLVGDALQGVGLKPNKYTMALAQEIYDEHGQLGALDMLTVENLAQLTLKRLRENIIDEHVNGLDDDGLLGWLGDDRTKRIQEILVARAKGQKREERAAKKEEHQPSNGNGSGERKQMTEAQLKQKYGW